MAEGFCNWPMAGVLKNGIRVVIFECDETTYHLPAFGLAFIIEKIAGKSGRR